MDSPSWTDPAGLSKALGRIEGLLTGRFDEVAHRLSGIEGEQSAQRRILDEMRDRQARLEERVGALERARVGVVEWARAWGGWLAAAAVTIWATLRRG